MVMMKFGLTAAALAIGAVHASVAAQPDIGGTPAYWEQDTFTGGIAQDWGLEVTSYVFDSTSPLPTGFDLDLGEMLFMYLLVGDDQRTVSVDKFSVGNPDGASITEVGYSDDIGPDILDLMDYQDPYFYIYSPPSLATFYSFYSDFGDPFATLEPDEWSLVWYIAEADGWQLGNATASGLGYGDTQSVPVPLIPEPGTALLLGLAGLIARYARRR